jgi:hypothetical protein
VIVDEEPIQSVAGDKVNVEVGALVTMIVLVVVEEQVPLLTVSVTVLVPVVDQATDCGPAVEAVAGVASNPKFHEYVEPAGAVPVYVSVALDPIHIVAGIVNVDVGGATTVTACVDVPGKHDPLEGVTVNPTLYVPGLAHVVLTVPVPEADAGLPEANVHAPVPAAPPV